MSIQAISWAFSLGLEILSDPVARHVLVILANYAGEGGKAAFPSKETIRQHTGLSIRTIGYKLDLLKEMGLISEGSQAVAAAYISRSDRRPVVYDLDLKRGAVDAPRNNERGANKNITGCSSRHRGVQVKTKRGAGAAPNPSLIHQVTDKEEEQEQNSLPFLMNLDWQPDTKSLEPRALISGLKIDLFTADAIGDFKVHFEASGRAQTSAQWHASLIGWVKRNHRWSARMGSDRSAIGFESDSTDWRFQKGI